MWKLLSFRLFSMVRPLQTADASGRRTYKIAGIFKEDDLQGIRRFQGYAETLFEVGLQVDDRHIWWFHSNHEMWIQNKYSVEYSLDDLMECTALVCYNDMLAEEIYHDLSQKGIRIPQDLSIVGFDNQNIKLDGDCYLTSVQHPRRKLGETAANLVWDMIEQGCNVAPAEPIIMPSTIVARNSIIRRF
ncbi:MAG: substrate-binding domain-containing protein [Blautia wexlerae]